MASEENVPFDPTSFEHIPVLLNECLEGLAIDPAGTYLDGTAGGAGHSRQIALRLDAAKGGRLISLDQDPDAVQTARARLAGLPATVVQINFRYAGQALEELGIGRPSTYAPTITTIINRRYVAKENKNLYMTELGEIVNNMMKQAFPSIVDVNFTANMEGLLDCVGDGKVAWKTVVRNFWPDLAESVSQAEKELEEVKIEDEVTDVICDVCGRNMVVKYGPHGKFLACPGFPDCRNTKPYLEKIGVKCPKCGGEVILKKTKKGRRYYGCEHNPECDFMTWQRPSSEKCPKCAAGWYAATKNVDMLQQRDNKYLLLSDRSSHWIFMFRPVNRPAWISNFV